MGLQEFLPDWWAEQVEDSEEGQQEALRLKVAGIFGQLGGPELSGG